VWELEAAAPLSYRGMRVAVAMMHRWTFGTGAPVITIDGKRPRIHVLRIVLSYSRKAHGEAVHQPATGSILLYLGETPAHDRPAGPRPDA
jgi:hypothetical protein